MTTTDHRTSAKTNVDALVALLRAESRAELANIIDECEALSRAIAAFHIEGIRFRMFNVDRLLNRAGTAIPDQAPTIFLEVRRELEAAGFHTRSHQAPPTA
jgi:hypothetical protein